MDEQIAHGCFVLNQNVHAIRLGSFKEIARGLVARQRDEEPVQRGPIGVDADLLARLARSLDGGVLPLVVELLDDGLG